MKSDNFSLTSQWQAPVNPGDITGTISSINSNGTATQKSRLGDLNHEICGLLAEIYNNHVAHLGDLSFDEAVGVLSGQLKEKFPLMRDQIAHHEANGFLMVIGYK